MNFVIIFAAFFFSLLMCLGLILMKWIITQIGAGLFLMVLFLMVCVFLLAMGDEKYGNE